MVSWSVIGNDGHQLNSWTATWISSYNRTFIYFNTPQTYDSAAQSCLGLANNGPSELENKILNFSHLGDAWVGFRKESFLI